MPEFEESTNKQNESEHYTPNQGENKPKKEGQGSGSNLRGRWKPSTRNLQLGSSSITAESLKPLPEKAPEARESENLRSDLPPQREPRSPRGDTSSREDREPKSPRRESSSREDRSPRNEGEQSNRSPRETNQRTRGSSENPSSNRQNRPSSGQQRRNTPESASSARRHPSGRSPVKKEGIIIRILRFLGLAPKKKMYKRNYNPNRGRGYHGRGQGAQRGGPRPGSNTGRPSGRGREEAARIRKAGPRSRSEGSTGGDSKD